MRKEEKEQMKAEIKAEMEAIFQKQFAELYAEQNALLKKIVGLETQLIEKTTENNQFKKKNKALEVQNNTLKEELEKVKKENQILKEKNDQKTQQTQMTASHNAEIEALKLKNAQLKKLLEKADTKAETHKKQFTEQTRLINDLKKQIDALKVQVQGVDKETMESWNTSFNSLKNGVETFKVFIKNLYYIKEISDEKFKECESTIIKLGYFLMCLLNKIHCFYQEKGLVSGLKRFETKFNQILLDWIALGNVLKKTPNKPSENHPEPVRKSLPSSLWRRFQNEKSQLLNLKKNREMDWLTLPNKF